MVKGEVIMHRLEERIEKAKGRNDVYTGLLAVSLIGMLISCGLLLLDYRHYVGVKPPQAPLAAR
jgi:hypothetical protein